MPEYRTGRHWGVTIVREGERPAELDDCAFCCVSRLGCPTHPAVEAQLVAVVVNGDTALADRICALLNRGEEGYFRERLGVWPTLEPADSCTCTKAGPDPACIVHQGRRARGPKPPPVGPGCICDGSGRTCPRHGAVT